MRRIFRHPEACATQRFDHMDDIQVDVSTAGEKKQATVRQTSEPTF